MVEEPEITIGLAACARAGDDAMHSNPRTTARNLAAPMKLSCRAPGLAADQVPDVVAILEQLDRFAHLDVARSRQVDLDFLADARRPCGEHHHAVGEEHGLVDVVRDEDDGFSRSLPEAHQLFLHLLARLRVERAERLVHQQHLRIEGEDASERGALLHPARELRRIVIAELGEADHGELPRYHLVYLFFSETLRLEAPGDVAGHALPRKERELLEHHAAVGPRAAHFLAVDADAAGLGGDEAADDVQERALAAAARPDHGDELALAHRELRDLDDGKGLAAALVALGDARGFQRVQGLGFSALTGQPCSERSKRTPASCSLVSKKMRSPSLARSTGGGGCGVAPARFACFSAAARS